MKTLMHDSLAVWAKRSLCGLVASALFIGCSSGPKWLSRNDDQSDAAKSSSVEFKDSQERDRFAVASRELEQSSNAAKKKRGFFSRLWKRDEKTDTQPEKTGVTADREYQPFESNSLSKHFKRDPHPATREPFLAAELIRRDAKEPVGRVHLGSEDLTDNRSATRTVSRTVIKETGAPTTTNDNPFALLEHKPTRKPIVRESRSATAKSPTADRIRNQFAPGFDSRINDLSKTVPQKPVEQSPTRTVSITKPAIEAAPFPAIEKPTQPPQKEETPKPSENPFETLQPQSPSITQQEKPEKTDSMDLEAILKDNRTRVDAKGRVTENVQSQADKKPVEKKPVEEKSAANPFSPPESLTIPVIEPPKPELANATGRQSSADRSMIVDSENLTDRKPVFPQTVPGSGNTQDNSTLPKITRPVERKPIKIRIIPRRRSSPPVEYHDIPLNDVTKKKPVSKPESPIVQVTASRVIETPRQPSKPLLQWRAHPNAKRSTTHSDIVDGFVPVDSSSTNQSRITSAPGPFPTHDDVDYSEKVVQDDAGSSAGSPEAGPESSSPRHSPIWLILAGLAIAIGAITIRRRRSQMG